MEAGMDPATRLVMLADETRALAARMLQLAGELRDADMEAPDDPDR
jgi:hypothetical protein